MGGKTMTDREQMIEIMRTAERERCFVTSCENCKYKDEGGCLLGLYADAIIEAGFISLKKSSDMARETCDILRRIKDDEIYRITKEREDLAHRLKIAKLALDAMSDTLLTADGGCDEICPVWDNECIRLKVAVSCKEAQRSDRIAHCVERWKQYALEEYLKPKEE